MKQALKQFLLQISAEAGEFLRNHFYTFKNVFQQDIGSYVTNVDLELEDILARRLRQTYPEYQLAFVGHDTPASNAEYVWIIDALDGSSHFARNIPIYTCNLALQHRGKTVMAAVNAPETRQLFFAQTGKGAQLNGLDIQVSGQDKLDQAFVYVELPERKFAKQADVSGQVEQGMRALRALIAQTAQVETFRLGAIGQCLVAAGSFDAYVDLSGSSQALSQAAGQLIVRESGGEIINL